MTPSVRSQARNDGRLGSIVFDGLGGLGARIPLSLTGGGDQGQDQTSLRRRQVIEFDRAVIGTPAANGAQASTFAVSEGPSSRKIQSASLRCALVGACAEAASTRD